MTEQPDTKDPFERLPDLDECCVQLYAHGGGRVWRGDDDGLTDLVLDLYSPEERRDAILLAIREAPKLRTEVAALRKMLEGKDGLLAAYRAGRPASEKTWRLLDEARMALAALNPEDPSDG